MKIAVIGAGFAGLAAAYYLSECFNVTLFHQGSGASKASSGLLHPYPGEQGRRSWYADESMDATLSLLKVAEKSLGRPVASYTGILKLGQCLSPGPDVERIGDEQFLIKSGITVFPEIYLEGLWQASHKRGVISQERQIGSLQEVDQFDRIVLAAGAGIRNFPECSDLKVNFVKGQVLTCLLDEPMERSISAKRYRALTSSSDRCHLGATYEREFTTELPCLQTATFLLQPDLPVIDCRAGVRVTNRAHYFPLIHRLNPKTQVITALGSRGLLYHAFLARRLMSLIRKEF